MEIRNELELYNHVIKFLPLGPDPLYNQIQRNGRTLHIVGESHGCQNAVKLVHHFLVPQIEAAPKTWALVREGVDGIDNSSRNKFEEMLPDAFYFHNLPHMLGMPVFDALGDITNKQRQKDISERTGRVSVEEIRAFYHTMVRQHHASKCGWRRADEYAAYDLNVTAPEYRRYAHLIEDQSVVSKVMGAWNVYGRMRLDEWLPQQDRTNILVSCGQAHFPAFEIDA